MQFFFALSRVLTSHPSHPVGADIAVADRPTFTVTVNDVRYPRCRMPNDCSHGGY